MALHHIHFSCCQADCDITGLAQSSFCHPSSGQSAFTPCTLNLPSVILPCRPICATHLFPITSSLSSLRLHLSLHLHVHHQDLESAGHALIPITAGILFCCDGSSESNLKLNSVHQLIISSSFKWSLILKYMGPSLVVVWWCLDVFTELNWLSIVSVLGMDISQDSLWDWWHPQTAAGQYYY